MACEKGKSCNTKFLQPAHATTQILEYFRSCWKL